MKLFREESGRVQGRADRSSASLPSRRGILGILGVSPAFLWAAADAQSNVSPGAANRAASFSLLGDEKYGDGFAHFDYVNPNAPKGGRIRITNIGAFDSLNALIVEGSPARGVLAIYETLTIGSLDEAATQYCYVAREIEYPLDYSWVVFHLRPEARFHDGVPITADDVVFSMKLLKEGGVPYFRQYYANVGEVRKIDSHSVMFRFSSKGSRELISVIGQLTYLLPKHYWLGKDAHGASREFSRSTLEPPLGSGPYRIGKFEPGRFIEYERVKDHWSRNLPVNVGQNNFDIVRYDFFRDSDVAVTAFLSDAEDVRLDMNPKSWATRYDVPPVWDGRIKRMMIPDDNPNGMEGFFFNLREPKFQDPRVRKALLCAFNFEWTNRHLLYGLCKRLNSYFENSDLAATGLPTGQELDLLVPYKSALPSELFTQAFRCPIATERDDNRSNLGEAVRLFGLAGYSIRDGAMVSNTGGEPFTIEFIDDQPSIERVLQPYLLDLAKIGVRGRLRVIDTSQYQNRLSNFDFDMTSDWKRQSPSPGRELRDFFGSSAADVANSLNVAGIKNRVVDALIEKVIEATDRPQLIAAVRALDRVLLWNYYCVPQWCMTGFPCAYWDRFGFPRGRMHLDAFPAVWWSREEAPDRRTAS